MFGGIKVMLCEDDVISQQVKVLLESLDEVEVIEIDTGIPTVDSHEGLVIKEPSFWEQRQSQKKFRRGKD